jgi:hypothetical protein
MTLLDKMNKFPPMLCRFAARSVNGREGMTTKEVSVASGLKMRRIYEISQLKKWDTLTFDEAMKFSMGCGVNLLQLRRHKFHLKHHKKIHAVEQYNYFKNLLT